MFENVIAWFVSPDGGAFIAVTWAASWALEDVAAWHKLSSRVRSLAILGVAIVLGLGAKALQQNPQIVAAIEPYATTATYIVLAWLATQLGHKGNKFLSAAGQRKPQAQTQD